jgi:hypothetical protein
MTRCSAGRRVAWIGLLAGAVLILAAAFNSRTIATQFFLRRLRSDPGLLEEYWARPGDLRRAAAKLFVVEPEGSVEVMRRYVERALVNDEEADSSQWRGEEEEMPSAREFLRSADVCPLERGGCQRSRRDLQTVRSQSPEGSRLRTLG